MIDLALVASACGGGDESDSGGNGSPEATADSANGSPAATSEGGSAEATGSPASGEASGGGGVILADLCSENQPLNGAISLDDLVSYGLLSSTDATVEGSNAYGATAYETFGFLCNISEDTGDGENFLTIGVSSGTAIWDLAVEQGTVPAEQIGDWEVIVGSNWLSPLTMRTTDDDGNQDSLFVTWTPADGSIPDAETTERVMRPLAEAIATRSTVDIPRS
ncbi:MAG: hypothetical protein O3A76_10895 [Chloroflexi bacterium]|nr:hypothetical protein [Chloroflexota bacterium]